MANWINEMDDEFRLSLVIIKQRCKLIMLCKLDFVGIPVKHSYAYINSKMKLILEVSMRLNES